MYDDEIKFAECHIAITSRFNQHGEPIYKTEFDGEALYPHALGLLEIAKDHIKEDATIRAEEEEEED